MCIVCVNNPIDMLDDPRIERYLLSRGLTGQLLKRWREDLIRWKSRVIKQTFDAIDDNDSICDVGDSITEDLKERQYALSREL